MIEPVARQLVPVALLMALARAPSHGWELWQNLDPAIQPNGPGHLYRHLREFDKDGLLQSEWDNTGTGRGPTTRVYQLTDEG